MLCLGFSSGLPILLVFSTLSVWLVKAGVSRSTVTLFSWAGFAYAFKYLWSPIIDNFKIPFFRKLGHRRSWLLLSQILIVISLILTSLSNPQNSLFFTATAITLLAFSSATQDIIIDAFRIESAPQHLQGPLSSMYIAGYRIAMLVGGAGSLWLAAFFGSEIYNNLVWTKVYLIMCFFMSVGIIATLCSEEPKLKKIKSSNFKNHIKFIISILISIFAFIYLYSFLDNPFKDDQVFSSFIFGILRMILCLMLATFIILSLQ